MFWQFSLPVSPLLTILAEAMAEASQVHYHIYLLVGGEYNDHQAFGRQSIGSD
jgi:hypothetical protein